MSDNNVNTTYLRINSEIPPDPQEKPEAGKFNNYNLRKNGATAIWIVIQCVILMKLSDCLPIIHQMFHPR